MFFFQENTQKPPELKEEAAKKEDNTKTNTKKSVEFKVVIEPKHLNPNNEILRTFGKSAVEM